MKNFIKKLNCSNSLHNLNINPFASNMGCKDLPVCVLSFTLLIMSFFFYFLLWKILNINKSMQSRIMSFHLPIT